MDNKPSQNKEDKSFSALSLAWELGYLMAIPLVVLALLGRFLDKTWGTSPWLLLVGIGLSLLISSWTVYLKVTKIIVETAKDEKKEKENVNK